MSQIVFTSLKNRFEELESHLNQLDAASGDGDHGSTMLKGLQAAAANPQSPAREFRRAAGGASGSLFSILISALVQLMQNEAALTEALTEAVTRIKQIGQANAGDKTMLDALIPACSTDSFEAAASAAKQGAMATKMMAAKKGRARYVEGAGVGHIDAGATSVAEILDVFAKCYRSNVNHGQ